MVLNEQTLRKIIRDLLEEQMRDPKGVVDLGRKGLGSLFRKGKLTKLGGRFVGAPAPRAGANRLYMWMLKKGITRPMFLSVTRALPFLGPWGVGLSTAAWIAWELYSYGSDDPAVVIQNIKADGGKKIKNRYRVIIRGKHGNVEKWFKTKSRRHVWMNCYKARGGGNVDFNLADCSKHMKKTGCKDGMKKSGKYGQKCIPIEGAAAGCPAGQHWNVVQNKCVPADEPKPMPVPGETPRKRRRRGPGRCAGKGWGKYKMPANIPYKGFKDFYAALAGNAAALKALGRKDCRWGSKHVAAHGILKGVSTPAARKCLPGQKPITDLKGNVICWPPKERLKKKPEDESLKGLGGALGWSGPGKTTHHPLGPTLQEQRYDRLVERLLKEIKKS